jgi:hypothetical protein
MGTKLAALSDSNGRCGNCQRISITAALLTLYSVGNFFAVGAGTSLRIAVGSAYIQYVWHRLKHAPASLETVDNTFDAMSSILAFGHISFLKTMYVGIVALIVFWLVHTIPVYLSLRRYLQAPGVFQLRLYFRQQHCPQFKLLWLE